MRSSHHNIAAGANDESLKLGFAAGLRPPAKIILGFLAYVAVASLAFPLSSGQRAIVWGTNLMAGMLVLLLNFREECEPALIRTSRHWVPAVLILLAYRESGLLQVPDSAHHFDNLFIQWDRVLLANRGVEALLSACTPWLQHYLEFCYLMCYPLVPLGAGILYLAQRSQASARNSDRTLPSFISLDPEASDRFWTAILLATLACYVIFPFVPLTPPRVLYGDNPWPAVGPLLRKMNLWLLDRYSVQACIFPSGHVAAVTAEALVLRRLVPRFGWVFVLMAVSIALATVVGRYHYAADAIVGAAVGALAFWIANRIEYTPSVYLHSSRS